MYSISTARSPVRGCVGAFRRGISRWHGGVTGRALSATHSPRSYPHPGRSSAENFGGRRPTLGMLYHPFTPRISRCVHVYAVDEHSIDIRSHSSGYVAYRWCTGVPVVWRYLATRRSLMPRLRGRTKMGRRRWVWQAILDFLSLMLRRGRPLTAPLGAAPWAQCVDWASRRATHASDGGGPGPRSP